MSVTFRVEAFEGPLDLLLQLVESQELDISTLSLAKVAEQFVEHVHENPAIPPEELADFLVVAAKLMYLKSKLLLPSLVDPEMEEGPDLESQLRDYQRFVQAAREIDVMWKAGRRAFPRAQPSARPRETGFQFPAGLTLDALRLAMGRVIARVEPILRLPQANIERAVTIQEKIRSLFDRLQRHAKTSFHTFLKDAKNKTEAVVSFLALLELVKRRFVRVAQNDLFNDIDIESHPEAEGDPLADPITAG